GARHEDRLLAAGRVCQRGRAVSRRVSGGLLRRSERGGWSVLGGGVLGWSVLGGGERAAATVGQQRLEIEEVEAEAPDEDGLTRRQLVDRRLRRQARREVGEPGIAGEAPPLGALIAQCGGDVADAQDDGVDVDGPIIGEPQRLRGGRERKSDV